MQENNNQQLNVQQDEGAMNMRKNVFQSTNNEDYQEAVFEEIEATASETTSQSNLLDDIEFEKGVLFYTSKDGTTGYQVLGGSVSLQDLVFYNAYSNRIVDEYWHRTENE